LVTEIHAEITGHCEVYVCGSSAKFKVTILLPFEHGSEFSDQVNNINFSKDFIHYR
jgi:hypothetical protein